MINKSTSQHEMTAAERASSKSGATPMQLWTAQVGLLEKTTAEGGRYRDQPVVF